MTWNSITIKSNGKASEHSHDANALVDNVIKIKDFEKGFNLKDLVRISPINFPTEAEAFIFISRPDLRDYCRLGDNGMYYLTEKGTSVVGYTVVQGEFDGSSRNLGNNKRALDTYKLTREASRRRRSRALGPRFVPPPTSSSRAGRCPWARPAGAPRAGGWLPARGRSWPG